MSIPFHTLFVMQLTPSRPHQSHMPRCIKKSAAGFTLVELLVVISIVGILTALAAPSFASLIERMRIEADVGQLRNSLAYARTEAMRTGQNISVCRRVAGANTCETGGSTGWETGWLVFTDPPTPTDPNGTGVYTANSNTLLRVADPMQGATGNANNGNAMRNYINFNAEGIPTSAGIAVGCLRVCSARTGCTTANPNNRYLIMNRIGRLRTITEDELSVPPNNGIC